MLLASENRDTELKILDVLTRKYGSSSSSDQLRVDFFDCKQLPGEGIEDFMLRLRESFNRWRSRDPVNVGSADSVVRAQFARGLRDGPTKRELQRELRRASPTLSFGAACEEALALEREFMRGEDVMPCQARAVPPSSRPPPPALNIEQIKETLRTEMRQEIKEQVSSLGKEITEEFRDQMSAFSNSFRSGWNDHPPVTSRNTRPFQWDVCKDCGEVGHVQRFCPRRKVPPQGFQVRWPL